MSVLDQINVKSLAKLLNTDEGSSDEESQVREPNQKTGPADICQEKVKEASKQAEKCKESTKSPKIDKNSIWSIEELKESIEIETNSICEDSRKIPVYQMFYQQSVTTEDIFLQMDGKTNATASCENLIVEVDLPGETLSQVKLKVNGDNIEIKSCNYFLHLALPHPINPKSSNAKWETEKEKLVLRLKLEKDFM